jgi:hypothetical protein
MIKLENVLIAIYGVATVVVFLIMISFGGLFDSVHTLLFQEVSFLISPYSLTENITVPLYQLYNINLLLFSVVLLFRMRNVFAKIGALYLSLSSVTGLMLIQFPMDAIHLSRSFAGGTHILLALLTAFYIMVALLLFGYSFKKNKNLKILSTYSVEISLIIMIAGFLTGISALLSMPVYVGILQKLPIAAFLFWIVLTAFFMLRSDRRIHYAKQVKRKSN